VEDLAQILDTDGFAGHFVEVDLECGQVGGVGKAGVQHNLRGGQVDLSLSGHAPQNLGGFQSVHFGHVEVHEDEGVLLPALSHSGLHCFEGVCSSVAEVTF